MRNRMYNLGIVDRIHLQPVLGHAALFLQIPQPGVLKLQANGRGRPDLTPPCTTAAF